MQNPNRTSRDEIYAAQINGRLDTAKNKQTKKPSKLKDIAIITIQTGTQNQFLKNNT